MKRPRNVDLPEGTRPEEFALIKAASEGDVKSRGPLRTLLATRPDLVESVGTLAADAEEEILALGCEGNVLVEEARRAELNEMRRSLALPTDDALDRFLVERIALCWLALMQAEQSRAAKWSSGVSSEIGDFWDRRVGRLHADFLRACLYLARVRRLRAPGVQVNIAENQVNVAR